MELIIIRHGEPDLIGKDLSDPPLTDLGHRQAKATAQFLASQHLDALYVSPQRRAQQTSVPLFSGRTPLAARSVNTCSTPQRGA